MSEVARNIRQRFEQVSLTPTDANNEGSRLGVYSNQRVIPRTQQTHRGVAQFLGDISGLIATNYRQKVTSQAEQDAITGETTPEMQDNLVYRGTVDTAKAKAEGIKLASRAQAEVQQAYELARDEGQPFDVNAFVADRFAPILESSQSETFRSTLIDIQGRIAESLNESVARLDSQRQLEEDTAVAEDIVFTTFENAQSEEDFSVASEMLSTTLDELGLTQKDKRALILSGYLDQVDKAEDAERVSMLENKINSWLKKEDRGLLRRQSDTISSMVDSARKRIQIAEDQARVELAPEKDNNYMSTLSRLVEDPTSISDTEIESMVANNQLGVTDAENRSRGLELRRRRLSELDQLSTRTRTEAQRVEIQTSALNKLRGDNGVSVLEMTPEEQDELPQAIEKLGRAFLTTPPDDASMSGMQVLDAYVQDPGNPEHQQEMGMLAARLNQYIQLAYKAGEEPSVVKQLIPDVTPSHPRFRQGAALFEFLQSKTTGEDLGLSNTTIARYQAYNDMITYGMDDAEATDALLRAEQDTNLSLAQARTHIRDEVSTSDIRDAMKRITGDKEPVNFAILDDEIRDLAGNLLRTGMYDPKGAFEKATSMVARNTVVMDGRAYPTRNVPRDFVELYEGDDGSFKASIQFTLEDELGSPLPEEWFLAPAASAGRAGYLTIYDAETNLPVYDPETSNAVVLNPTRVLAGFQKLQPEMQRNTAIQAIKDKIASKDTRRNLLNNENFGRAL